MNSEGGGRQAKIKYVREVCQEALAQVKGAQPDLSVWLCVCGEY